jgi:glycosyltransferase involved in cell wall biosynthesis
VTVRPSVSVLLPAYNAGPFVDEAVGSVLAQTFEDWEVVAADDSSRDDTLERLRAWERRDPRIRVFSNATNLGMTGNWNRCLSEASGELVLKLDADDVLRGRALDVLVDPLRGATAIGAGVRTLLCTADGEPFGQVPADTAMYGAGIDPFRDHDLPCSRWMEVAAPGNQLWSSSAFMVRRDWLQATGGWDERLGCASDTEMTLRLLRAGSTFSHRAYVGLYYRMVPGSISDTYRKEGWLGWESVVVYLRNLEACPEFLRRSRRARQRRVVLWRRWVSRKEDRSWRVGVPEDLRSRLEDVMKDVASPTFRDRAMESLAAIATRLSR